MSLKLSAFDLDYTLVKKNSSLCFCLFLYRRKILPFSALIFSFLYYLKSHLMELSFQELHQKTFNRFLKGISLPLLKKYVEEFVTKELLNLLNMPVIERLKRCQHLGHYTTIFSASPGFLVEPIAQFLEVDGWIATDYMTNEKEQLSGVGAVIEGRNKAIHIEHLAKKLSIERKNITTYSDSISDLPFLLSGACAYVVNPDKKLSKIAQEKEWDSL